MILRRNTIQRDAVLTAVRELRCHATADEVYEAVVQKYPNISRATVYRNLKLLADEGMIRQINVPGGPERFDHKTDDHYHIRCAECGKVSDVDMPFQNSLNENVTDSYGFKILDHSIFFKGICPKCQELIKQKG